MWKGIGRSTYELVCNPLHLNLVLSALNAVTLLHSGLRAMTTGVLSRTLYTLWH